MSKLDFPSSPLLNQIFTQNGKSWIWDGTSWKNFNTATIDRGGTGLTGIGATDAFLSSNSAGTALTYRKFTAVSGILITVEPSEVKFNVISQAFSGSGTVNFGNQYEIPFYSQTGSGTLVTGSPNFVNVGTGISVLYNTVSNSTSTGALVVTGGVGIGGSLFVGDSSNIDGLLIESSTIKSGNWAGNSITAFYGGTGLKTFSDGDILVGLGGTWYNLQKSNNAGDVLTISASSPYLSWQAVQAGSAASSVNIGLDNANAERYIIFADSNGSGIYLSSDSDFRYNPSSNILSVGGISITSGTESISTLTGVIVARGGLGITGNAFIGGTITASLFTGNVSATAVTASTIYGNLVGTATSATNVFLTLDNTAQNNNYITFTPSSNTVTGGAQSFTDKIYVVPNTGSLNANILSASGVTVGIENNKISSSNDLILTSTTGNVRIDNNLNITGNLVVNGTTVSIASTVSTLLDPVFVLGAGIGGTNPTASDSKDRGIEFRYFSGTAKTGFFGYDDSTGYFTFLPDSINNNEVFSGVAGTALFTTVIANLSGTASTSLYSLQSGYAITSGLATSSSSIYVSSGASNQTHYLLFSPNQTGSGVAVSSGLGLTYNPSTGLATIGGTLSVTQRLTVSSNTNSTSTTTGAMVVTGGAGFGGTINIGQRLTVGSSLNSTSTTTGSAVFTGGLGVGGNAFIGGTITAPLFTGNVSSIAVTSTDFYGNLVGTATTSTNVNLNSSTSNITHYLILSQNASGSGVALSSGTGLTFNPNTNLLSASNIQGTLTTQNQPNITSVGILTSGVWSATAITAYYGGTGLSSFSDGDILVGLGGTWYNLPKSNNAGEVLTISASSPYLSWQAVQSGSAASSVNVGLDDANAQRFIIFAESNGSGIYLSSDAGIKYNPSSNILSVGGISITTGTNSSSTSSGALIIDGGIGITGNAFIGGTITASTFTGNVSATAVTSTNFYGNLTGFATTAQNVNVVSNTNSGQTFYLIFSRPDEGSGVALSSSTNITYTPNTKFLNLTSTGKLSVANIRLGETANTIDTSTGNLILDSSGGTVNINDNLIVSGNLTVNGTTTSIDSTITSFLDPVIVLGAGAGNTHSLVDDNQDRGVEFRYAESGTAITGFFGYKDDKKFYYIPNANLSGNVYTGTAGTIVANLEGIASTSNYSTLAATATSSANIFIATGSSNINHPIVFTPNSSSSGSALSTNTTLSYNPSTDTLNTSKLIAISNQSARFYNTTDLSSGYDAALYVEGGLAVSNNIAVRKNVLIGSTYPSNINSTQGAVGATFIRIVSPDFGYNGMGIQFWDGQATLATDPTFALVTNAGGSRSPGLRWSGSGSSTDMAIFRDNTNALNISVLDDTRGNLYDRLVIGDNNGEGTQFTFGFASAGNSRNIRFATVSPVSGTDLNGGEWRFIGLQGRGDGTPGTFLFSTGDRDAANPTTAHSTTAALIIDEFGVIVGFAKGTNSTSTLTGTARINGGLGITGNAFIGGTVTITNTTTSTLTTNGALVISGGVGIGGSVFVGNELNIRFGKELRIFNTANTRYNAFKTGANGVDITYTLPTALPATGTGNSVLVSNDSGTLSWTVMTGSGGGGAGTVDQGLQNQIPYYPSAGTLVTGSSNFTNIPGSGVSIINPASNSSSTTTGALVVRGGVGITGNLYVGGNVDVGTGYSFRINGISVLNSTTLGSSVINSSLTSLGIVTSGTWAATAITSAYGGIGAKPIVSKGDILVGAGNTWYNLPYSGSDNQVLTVDTAQPFGVKWAAVPPAAASSVAVKPTDEAGIRYVTFVNSSDSSGLALSTDTNLVYEADINRLTVGVLAGNGVTIGSTSNTISASNDLILTSNTNNVVVNNNLSITGNLTVNGTTTSIGSTITTLLDPIFVLGAGIGGTNPTADDNKDRGIEFRYYSGTAKTGFFGFDDSTGCFTFIPDGLNENEIFSGAAGTAQFTTVIGNLSGFANTSNNIRVQTTSNIGYHPLLFTPSANVSGSAISSSSTLVYEPSTDILTVSGLSVTSSVESSSTITGALKVSGGLAIAGNAFIGGTINVSQPISISNGGTNAQAGNFTNNGVVIYDGTRLSSATGLTFTSGTGLSITGIVSASGLFYSGGTQLPTGSAAANQVTYWSTANAITGNAALQFSPTAATGVGLSVSINATSGTLLRLNSQQALTSGNLLDIDNNGNQRFGVDFKGLTTITVGSGNTGLIVSGGRTILSAPTASYATVNLAASAGINPGSGVTQIGDLWFNGTNLYFRKDANTSQDLLADSLSGSGTANKITKWSASTALTDSNITDSGVGMTITATSSVGAAGGATAYLTLQTLSADNSLTSVYFLRGVTSTGTRLFSVDTAGNLRATTKSFDIPHPTKPGKRLVYGVLEGPEHGVYHRGTVEGKGLLKVELPEYWSDLVGINYTLQLTPYGNYSVSIFDKNDKYFTIQIVSNPILKKFKAFKVDYILHGSRKDAPLDIEQ